MSTAIEPQAAQSLSDQLGERRAQSLSQYVDLLFRIVRDGEQATNVDEVEAVRIAAGKTDSQFDADLATARKRNAAVLQSAEADRMRREDVQRLQDEAGPLQQQMADEAARHAQAMAELEHKDRERSRKLVAADGQASRLASGAAGVLTSTADPAIDAKIASILDSMHEIHFNLADLKASGPSGPRGQRELVANETEKVRQLREEMGNLSPNSYMGSRYQADIEARQREIGSAESQIERAEELAAVLKQQQSELEALRSSQLDPRNMRFAAN